MRRISIKDVITDKISGEWGDEALDTRGVVVIRAANFLNSGKINFSNLIRREIDQKKIEKKKLISGDIIIEKSGGSPTQPVGRVVIFQNPDDDTYLCNNFTSILRPNRSQIHPEFLFYLLSDNHKKGKTLGYQNKTTGIINLKLDSYLDSEILVPSLDDQIRIAHLLGKVEGLIAQRKQHLQQLDDLLKSVFLEMFGDPMRNVKHKISTLGPFIRHLTSGGRGWAKYYSLSGKRFIRSLDVQMNRIGSEETVFVNPPHNKETERTKIQSGDVLLTITGSKIGRVCYVPEAFEEAYVSQHVAIIRTEGINPIYLSFYLSMPTCGQRIINKQQYGQAKPGLNLTQISNFEILEPDISLQNQFAAIVEKVENLKSRYQQSLTDLESLYGALSQRAFKGELDLSRVPLPGTQPEEEKAAAVESLHSPPAEELVINLPDIDNLLDTLENTEARATLISQWLEAYRGQLGNMPFSVRHFMAAVQTRLAERYPDNDFVLGASDYEHIKVWVFDALAAGKLVQTFDDTNNRIHLKAVQL